MRVPRLSQSLWRLQLRPSCIRDTEQADNEQNRLQLSRWSTGILWTEHKLTWASGNHVLILIDASEIGKPLQQSFCDLMGRLLRGWELWGYSARWTLRGVLCARGGICKILWAAVQACGVSLRLRGKLFRRTTLLESPRFAKSGFSSAVHATWDFHRRKTTNKKHRNCEKRLCSDVCAFLSVGEEAQWPLKPKP